MKKYLIYTDVHFCQYSSIVRKRGKKYSVRLHNLIDSVSWAEHLADEENCDEVLMLGDFFDRSEINAEEVTALQDVYFCNKPHYFLTGNHDANIASLDFSTVQIFKSINASVISEVRRVEVNDKVDLYFIPYLTNDIRLPIENYLNNDNKKKVILSHNDISGIQYGRFKSTGGFTLEEILNNTTLFINGHLHNGYIINDKIILIGNLTGQNFNEDANKYNHYAYIMTIDADGNITLDPRINPNAFNFYKININSERDLVKLDLLKSNPVLSISCNSNLIKQVENKLKSIKYIEYKLFATYSNSNIEINGEEFKVENHFQQFINYIQTKIESSDVLAEEISLLGSDN